MTNHARGRRRDQKTRERRVRVFSDPNRDLRPEQLARIITAAGLEQARLEATARAENEARGVALDLHVDGEGGHA